MVRDIEVEASAIGKFDDHLSEASRLLAPHFLRPPSLQPLLTALDVAPTTLLGPKQVLDQAMRAVSTPRTFLFDGSLERQGGADA